MSRPDVITLFLLRHAAHDRVDRVLCGRMPGVSLGAAGLHQASLLGAALQRHAPDALFTSPLERSRMTADVLGDMLNLTAQVSPELTEIDCGEWTGREFAELREDPRWLRWNSERAASRPPGGETMAEAGERVLDFARTLRRRYPNGVVALVSHADVIKAALAAVLGLTLDAHDRFDIAPASISTLVLWEGGGKVVGLNAVPQP
ncbi:histidine phosphatase family protein [Plastoroseomonas arctica]|uniref:Histidine phosphatase family protein n=1 Tax=Plastoroseomonas arctica TaxID=1509237 RepID=A0AAF1JWN9_9PROT|nr:histidine phosphatase family protein [Plastoroseomonas arctica]MBR0654173.1 histidine phosphatase family protein [Plastoroseomonas arctica]